MRLFSIFVGLTIVFAVPFLIWGERVDAFFESGAAAEWLEDFGPWAGPVALAMLAADLVAPIPATAIMAALGYLYGPVVGGAFSVAGSVLSGLIAYGLCRAIGERAARRILGEADFARGRAWFGKTGGWAIALSRWMPLLPEVIACMAGLTRMPFDRFALALICGSAPLGFAYAAIGAAGDRHPRVAILLSVCLPPALWLLLGPALRRLRRGDAPGAAQEVDGR